jgi:hypothetical protein
MTKLLLLPGGLICDAVGLKDSESRQILRMFLNTREPLGLALEAE